MNNRGAFTFRVDGGVEASGAQAKKQRKSGGGADRKRDDETTARPEEVDDGGRRRESELRERSAGSKGSYYNKFVGGLRSGNNSETASDSKDVLIVAFIQMEVEGDELQRMRPVSMRPSRLSPSSLCIYTTFSFEFSVGVVLSCLAQVANGDARMTQQ